MISGAVVLLVLLDVLLMMPEMVKKKGIDYMVHMDALNRSIVIPAGCVCAGMLISGSASILIRIQERNPVTKPARIIIAAVLLVPWVLFSGAVLGIWNPSKGLILPLIYRFFLLRKWLYFTALYGMPFISGVLFLLPAGKSHPA